MIYLEFEEGVFFRPSAIFTSKASKFRYFLAKHVGNISVLLMRLPLGK